MSSLESLLQENTSSASLELRANSFLQTTEFSSLHKNISVLEGDRLVLCVGLYLAALDFEKQTSLRHALQSNARDGHRMWQLGQSGFGFT